ncbi:MAG: uridine kinase [Prolixibacteraceae bacterium]|jgi:uridine kinase|nr:uridine kinase [Prolixibacteraceae bacterium]MBT6766040.1 uridine kinase [Prolixibacteraceae bacterium]MBT6998439.1 uridine kinase [Prolixibacteraceae bacterium]MBT7397271.1 uridine kinase [Prolixibacteraceae bacterium]
MLGDVLLINELHKKAADSIYKTLLKDISNKKKGYRFIVAISGESGAGKSELSHSLALLLKKEGQRVKILHTDNYYKIPPNLRTQWRKDHGVKHVGTNEYDWKLLNRNIKEFKEGREALMPCIDIVSKQTDKLITDFSDIDILVVDGLYAIKLKTIDLRVYIDLTYHETKKNIGKRGKENSDAFRFEVLEMEHRNMLALKPRADLIVNKSYEVEETEKAMV